MVSDVTWQRKRPIVPREAFRMHESTYVHSVPTSSQCAVLKASVLLGPYSLQEMGRPERQHQENELIKWQRWTPEADRRGPAISGPIVRG